MDPSPRTVLPPVAERQPAALQTAEACPADEMSMPHIRVTEVSGENWQITHKPGGESIVTHKELRCVHGWHTQRELFDAFIDLEGSRSGPITQNGKWRILPEIAWGPFKPRILELHVTRGIPLTTVRRMLETEFGFRSELRHYRTRVRKWKQEMGKQPNETATVTTQQRKRKHDAAIKTEPQESAPIRSPALSNSPPDDADSMIHDSPTLYSASSASVIASPRYICYSDYISPYASYASPSIESGLPKTPYISGNRPAPEPEVQSPAYLREEEEIFRKALVHAEASSDNSFPNVEIWLIKVIDILMKQGRYKAAEMVTHKLLNGRRYEYGYSHFKTLQAEDLLGETLRNQGMYSEAEIWHRRTARELEKKLGSDNSIALKSIENLAVALMYQGNYLEAEPYFWQTLYRRQRILGKYDQAALSSAVYLAEVSALEKKYEEAEIQYRRAIGWYKVHFSDWFPDVLRANRSLAKVLTRNDEVVEAKSILQRGVDLSLEKYGVEHPESLSQMHDFAMALWNEGRTIEAEPMLRRVLKERELLLGPDHHDTIDTVKSLGSILRAEERFEEAQLFIKRVSKDRERVLGLWHPDTMSSMDEYSEFLKEYRASL